VRRTVLIAIAALLVGTSAFAQSNKISIEFEKQRVVVKGVVHGKSAALYGVAHAQGIVYPQLLRWTRELVDDDSDGVVSLDLGRDVPVQSVWIVADLQTLQYTTASPQEVYHRKVPGRGLGVVDSPKGPRSLLKLDGAVYDLFIVRKSTGAWVSRAGDGAGGDEDGLSDGIVSIDPSKLKSVGATRVDLTSLERSDLIVAIDPESLDFSIIAIPAE
jgi:hypothetical protein